MTVTFGIIYGKEVKTYLLKWLRIQSILGRDSNENELMVKSALWPLDVHIKPHKVDNFCMTWERDCYSQSHLRLIIQALKILLVSSWDGEFQETCGNCYSKRSKIRNCEPKVNILPLVSHKIQYFWSIY